MNYVVLNRMNHEMNLVAVAVGLYKQFVYFARGYHDHHHHAGHDLRDPRDLHDLNKIMF